MLHLDSNETLDKRLLRVIANLIHLCIFQRAVKIVAIYFQSRSYKSAYPRNQIVKYALNIFLLNYLLAQFLVHYS